MPRPKGSKNKTAAPALEQEDTVIVEFDYEKDDARFDTAYNPLSVTGSTHSEEVFIHPSGSFRVDPFTPPVETRENAPKARKMFLVEGEVQLTPRVPGRGAIVAKQFRLVMAMNEEEAIGKYAGYFQSLSDAESAYTVVSAAAMEPIE